MKTYIFCDKNSSNCFITSQETEEEAWQELEESLIPGYSNCFRLSETEEEEEDE